MKINNQEFQIMNTIGNRLIENLWKILLSIAGGATVSMSRGFSVSVHD